MTTIAYHHKDKQIAVDSRLHVGREIIDDNADKMVKNEIGIWFITGATCDYNDLITLKHNDEVKPVPECSALLIKDGEAYVVIITTEGYCCYTKLTYDYTIGSGQHFATGAMDHGKSAKEAVKYAMTRDVYTGGKVRVFKVK